MNQDAGAAGQAAFEQGILACMRDLDALLPDLKKMSRAVLSKELKRAGGNLKIKA